jgi:hypothetical protein
VETSFEWQAWSGAELLLLPLLWDMDDPIEAKLRFAPGGVLMIHALLVVAVVLFVLWLLFHATGGLVNLIWLVIIVLVGLWLFGLIRGRTAR